MFLFYIPPENIKKLKVFLRFLGGIEMEHRAKMGWVNTTNFTKPLHKK